MNDRHIFEQKFKIYSYQVDKETYLTIPSLFCFMQEVAWEHVNFHKAGRDYLHPLHLFWALSRVHVQINRLPKWNEEILVRTWGKKVEFLTHPRDYEFYDSEGNLLIAATSNWIILDTPEYKPREMPALDTSLYTCEDRHAIEKRAPKIKKIDFSQKTHDFHPVLYSDLDMNQHTNNAKYLQWLFDSPDYKSFSIGNIKEIIINYLSQAKEGDEYTIFTEETAPQDKISTFISRDGEKEYCRIEVRW